MHHIQISNQSVHASCGASEKLYRCAVMLHVVVLTVLRQHVYPVDGLIRQDVLYRQQNQLLYYHQLIYLLTEKLDRQLIGPFSPNTEKGPQRCHF